MSPSQRRAPPRKALISRLAGTLTATSPAAWLDTFSIADLIT